MEQRRLTDGERFAEEVEFERTLRPTSFDDFPGQAKVKAEMLIYLQAAKQRGEALDHILLHGPPGLGKTSIAYLLARYMGSTIKITSGPALERPYDLVGLLTNLDKNDIFFIDEIHRLNHVVEEYLYSAMEDFALDIVIDKGPSARSIRLELKPFTLVGATTRAGLLTSPLRARFGIVQRLDFYTPEELFDIVKRSARLLQIECDTEGCFEIARRSRGTPRVANRLLRRVRDYAQVKADGKITKVIAEEALGMFEVDELGLDRMDKTILLAIIEKYRGGPVGLNTLSVAVGEESDTIEEVYEPFLIQLGLLERTPRGRQTTALAYQHFGLEPPQRSGVQTNLF